MSAHRLLQGFAPSAQRRLEELRQARHDVLLAIVCLGGGCVGTVLLKLAL